MMSALILFLSFSLCNIVYALPTVDYDIYDSVQIAGAVDTDGDQQSIKTNIIAYGEPGMEGKSTRKEIEVVTIGNDFDVGIRPTTAAPVLRGCGGRYRDEPTGSFTSPNYPNPYGNYRECRWHIIAPLDKKIEITIIDLQMEYHRNCARDFISIHEGEDEHSLLLLKACNHQGSPIIVTTSGNNAFIKFQSDITISGRGFSAKWKFVDSNAQMQSTEELPKKHVESGVTTETTMVGENYIPQSSTIPSLDDGTEEGSTTVAPVEIDVRQQPTCGDIANVLKKVLKEFKQNETAVKTKKYALRHNPVNWFQANQICTAEGKRLATIMSEEDNNNLKSTLGSLAAIPDSMWISATDLGTEGRFMWMSTGEPLTYTNWNKGTTPDGDVVYEPNNADDEEHCVTVVKYPGADFTWNDDRCDKILSFICEYF